MSILKPSDGKAATKPDSRTQPMESTVGLQNGGNSNPQRRGIVELLQSGGLLLLPEVFPGRLLRIEDPGPTSYRESCSTVLRSRRQWSVAGDRFWRNLPDRSREFMTGRQCS